MLTLYVGDSKYELYLSISNSIARKSRPVVQMSWTNEWWEQSAAVLWKFLFKSQLFVIDDKNAERVYPKFTAMMHRYSYSTCTQCSSGWMSRRCCGSYLSHSLKMFKMFSESSFFEIYFFSFLFLYSHWFMLTENDENSQNFSKKKSWSSLSLAHQLSHVLICLNMCLRNMHVGAVWFW